MSDQNSFEEMIQRLRDGDEQAATELVSSFEPEVRRFIRFRLTTPSIRRFIDSLDISQSVLARFFVELEQGAVQINSPAQLRNLLLTMAKNKLYDHARKEHAIKRDSRRREGELRLDQVENSDMRPSEQLAAAEVVQALKSHLTEDELYLVDQRMNGCSWADLATELQSTPDAIRKRMARAIDNAAKELGLIE